MTNNTCSNDCWAAWPITCPTAIAARAAIHDASDAVYSWGVELPETAMGRAMAAVAAAVAMGHLRDTAAAVEDHPFLTERLMSTFWYLYDTWGMERILRL